MASTPPTPTFPNLRTGRCHIYLESNVMFIAHIYKNTYTSISSHFHPSKLFCFFGKITWVFSPSSSLYAWGHPFLQSQARIALVRHLIDKVGSAQLLLEGRSGLDFWMNKKLPPKRLGKQVEY